MSLFRNMRIVGEYSTYFVPLRLKKEVMAALLPKWLKLAPHYEQYPVFLTLGYQQNVRFQWGAFNGPSFSYREFAIGIPYVQLAKTGQGPFFSFPRLYLNRFLPVVAGYFWGFAKAAARIKAIENRYQISSFFTNQLLIEGEFRPYGIPGRPSNFPYFEDMKRQKMLEVLPVVDRTMLGIFVCVKFDRNSERTEIQPVEAHIRIAESFLPGLPTRDFQVQGIDQVPLGAFKMRTPWTMSMPMKCTSENGNLTS